MDRLTPGVSAFPARRCVHCVRGRCVAALARDPAFQLKWQCRVVAGWDRALADGLARAEAFGLSPEAGERACRRSLSRVPGPEACENFTPHPALPCGLLWEDTCLLLPPKCPGPCPDFREGRSGE